MNPTLRDAILFVVGIAMLIHETVIAQDPRGLVLAAAFGLLGLPWTIQLDDKLTRSRSSRRRGT